MKEAKIYEVLFDTAGVAGSTAFTASNADGQIAPVKNHDFKSESARVTNLDFATDSAVEIAELNDVELRPAISDVSVHIAPAPFRDRTQFLRLKPAKVFRGSARGIPVSYPLSPLSSAPEDVQRRIVAEIAVKRRLSLSDVTVAGVHLKCPVTPPPREAAVHASVPPPVFTDFEFFESKTPGASGGRETGKISVRLPAEGKWPEPAVIAVCRDKSGAVFGVILKRAELD